MIHGFIKAYEAAATLDPYRIITFADPTNNSKITLATGPAQALVGTTGKIGGGIGTMVDVERSAIPRVQLGGTVAAGDWLTANAAGKAVKVTAAGQRTIGMAEQPGVVDDVIDYFAAPGVAGGA